MGTPPLLRRRLHPRALRKSGIGHSLSDFPLRSANPVPLSLSALAERLGAEAPASDFTAQGIAPLRSATSVQLGFLADLRYLTDLPHSSAGALLVSQEVSARIADDDRPRLVVSDPHVALANLLELFFPEVSSPSEIHPTAVLERGVRLGSGVRIGPFAVLESGVRVGDGARIGAHTVIGFESEIGEGCILHPHVVVYPRVVLGKWVILHAGARIGVDGFGYVYEGGRHRKVLQVGRCLIEDDVEIGANATIDRGSIGVTQIGQGSKIDNLVQVAHNVTVGPLSMLAAQVGVAGSTRIGAGVVAGGQAGFSGHISIGDGARIAAQSGVMGDIAAGATVMGFPARPRMEFLRQTAVQGRLEKLLREIREIRRQGGGAESPEE